MCVILYHTVLHQAFLYKGGDGIPISSKKVDWALTPISLTVLHYKALDYIMQHYIIPYHTQPYHTRYCTIP